MTYEAIITYNYPGKDASKRDNNIYDVEVITNDLGYPRIEYCCEKMEEAWENGFIGLGQNDIWCNTNLFLAIYRCRRYPEGACWYDMSIHFCPFCGEQILGKFIEDIKTSK